MIKEKSLRVLSDSSKNDRRSLDYVAHVVADDSVTYHVAPTVLLDLSSDIGFITKGVSGSSFIRQKPNSPLDFYGEVYFFRHGLGDKNGLECYMHKYVNNGSDERIYLPVNTPYGGLNGEYAYSSDGGITMGSIKGSDFVMELCAPEDNVYVNKTASVGSNVKVKCYDCCIIPFTMCANYIQGVRFNDQIYKIFPYAFNGCKNVREIVLPNSVTDLGIGCFEGCTNLSSVTLSSNITDLSENAFTNCAITSLYIPEGVMYIEYDTFKNNAPLSSVSLPSSLVEIKYDSFDRCSNLTNIIFNGTINKIPSKTVAPWGATNCTVIHCKDGDYDCSGS